MAPCNHSLTLPIQVSNMACPSISLSEKNLVASHPGSQSLLVYTFWNGSPEIAQDESDFTRKLQVEE